MAGSRYFICSPPDRLLLRVVMTFPPGKDLRMFREIGLILAKYLKAMPCLHVSLNGV
jgi:hypothetical protein